MSPSRRHVLALLAAAPVLPACAPSNLPDPIAAWRNPGAGETDPRRYALAHAILAPNPHNRQPWLIELPGQDEITLYFDTSRRLPETDPFDRQLTIGCGAFLELLGLAAAQQKLSTQVTPFPEGFDPQRLDARPVARVRLVPGAAPDPLFAQIVDRRSHKETYDKARPLTVDELGAIIPNAPPWAGAQPLDVAFDAALAGDARAERIRALIPAAYRREVETPAALKESIDLIRIGKAEIARHRDGIDLDFPGIDLMKAAGLITRAQMLKPGTQAYQQGLALYDPLAASAAGFVWLTSAPGRLAELDIGRMYARLNLQATANGVAMHPMSQALQEYPEMADLKAQMDEAVGLPAGRVLQMLARIGRAAPVPPAPRRGLAEHLR